MNSTNDMYKANSIRALRKISDVCSLPLKSDYHGIPLFSRHQARLLTRLQRYPRKKDVHFCCCHNRSIDPVSNKSDLITNGLIRITELSGIIEGDIGYPRIFWSCVACAPQSSMLGPMERYLAQAVVDKADIVSSAAIVTGRMPKG